MLKNKKVLLILIILLVIVVAGIALMCIKGMNYGLLYGQNTTIEMYLSTKPETSDVKNIITEIFGKDNNIRLVENSENDILITVKSANEEQINTLISKINEKYSLAITANDLKILNNPSMNIKDLIFSYLTPVFITTILILIYFIIKYKKIGMLKILAITLSTVIGVQLIYFSIYALTRIPVNEITMPISMLLFILSFIVLVESFEKSINSNKKA
ncbi:MAG: hypothetical protein Q4G09_01345 [Clostridia bacterium]|nr:hypothetical protein [Clostridia bacterium]